MRPITGSMLHDLVLCERRLHHDLHTDSELRDPVGDFVKMLWAGGLEHERAVLDALPGRTVDLRDVDAVARESATLDALAGSADRILGAALRHGDRLGLPDLIERDDAGWVAGDVKSGAALEPDGRRPRREYAVQVSHYASLLAAMGAGPVDRAFVIGRDGGPATYDLRAPWGRDGRSLVDMTATLTDNARLVRDGAVPTRGAVSAACKMCHWHTLCDRESEELDDPTLVAGVGRAVRDALAPFAPTVAALADLDVAPLALGRGRTRIAGLGAERLLRFRDRARLLRTPGATAYAMRPLGLAAGHREIHFDIEADPMRDGLVYLHGFLIREPEGADYRAEYRSFFADAPEQEGQAFAAAMDLLTADPEALVYYYSKYERTSFRALADRHPHVCSRDDVERLFDPTRAIDLLFDVIMPNTEWPTRNLSIKTLARFAGFDWRDVDAGGANSIAWFDEYIRTGDPAVRRRILSYNEDDVRASAVVLDALRALPVGGPPVWPPRAVHHPSASTSVDPLRA